MIEARDAFDPQGESRGTTVLLGSISPAFLRHPRQRWERAADYWIKILSPSAQRQLFNLLGLIAGPQPEGAFQ
jgi:hypothetical protein